MPSAFDAHNLPPKMLIILLSVTSTSGATDVVMPGMSGIELAQAVRSLYPDIPVVMTSGYSHILAHNGTYGVELLHKPYSMEDASQALRKAARGSRRRRSIDDR